MVRQKERMLKVLKLLHRYYPDAECALEHDSPLQLLIATILSAQCTDKRVNMITPGLFARYPDARSMSQAKLEDLEELIRSTGFYRNKAKNIKKCCTDLAEKFAGELPRNLEEMTSLAGVGRKTANVVLGTAFGLASGIVVDTHVGRLSQRLGFAREKNPVGIEKELQKLVPQKEWINYSHLLIHHGREVCKSRKPRCSTCFLEEICPRKGV